MGQLGPRKGIHLLLEAISRIAPEDGQLTIVGKLQMPTEVFARYAHRVTHIPTVPRSHIPDIMADHHALVFPSYFEGSALTLVEGLASGLAVIQSEFAGNGATPACGLILPELTVDAVTEAMMVPIRDRDLLDQWRSGAQSEAARYSFANYQANIAKLLTRL